MIELNGIEKYLKFFFDHKISKKKIILIVDA